MAYIPNKFVIFGAVAVAALAVPGLAGPLMFDEAYASHTDQSNEANQKAKGNVINAQLAIQANVDDTDVAACIVVATCNPQQD
jgi:hypothetical protein